jgi:transcriptional regulator with XRE-family HTH domain
MTDPWQAQLETLGGFIRIQRQLANLTLREMANRTQVSNAYLSQIERGLHEPSVRVLRSIATALGISPETLLAQAGLLDAEARAGGSDREQPATESAIRADPGLTDSQKKALLAVYASFLAANREPDVP